MTREAVLAHSRTALSMRAHVTPEEVEGVVRMFAALPGLSEPVDETVIRELAKQMEREFAVSLGPAHTITSDHRPWLRAKAHQIDFHYWRRYRDFLVDKGFGAKVVNTLTQITDNILDLAGDPEAPGEWSRRGLVVGHVQSGKTANYLGVINKAADAGYRLIVLIAGTHNNLRSQTQERVDEGFVGRDSDQILSRQANAVPLGVGWIERSFSAVAYTSRGTDFARARAEGLGIPIHNLAQPAIFVIKKNPSILRNLIDWLSGTTARHGRLDMPMLVIDDEADNASVNTSQDPDRPNTINRLIRELLQLSSRNTYIGYTATPFANIFIDPDTMDDVLGDDLFPRHFIIGLDAPTNYVGAREFFLNEESAHLTVDLEDTESWLPASHRIEHEVEGLHYTLIDAIGCYVVSKAIRILRQQGRQHHSMLVNVSRFTRVQGDVAQLIAAYLQLLKDAIQNRHALSVQSALHDPYMRGLHRVWQQHYAHLPEQWPQIQQSLHEAAASMSVVEINASRNSGSLEYRAHAGTGLNVIAVGGNSLSRGFTLEGLTVSYFLRNTQMYDTLLQMGRWFGYRDGFGDLCRLFIKPEAHDWYAFIAEASEELRDEIRRMETANLTPQDFGLAVRSHPGSLLVTARNKMRTAKDIVREVGLADRLVESTVIHAGGDAQQINVDQVHRLVSALINSNAPEPVGSRDGARSQLFRAVEPEAVMEFVSAFLIHRGNPDMQTGPLLEYIRRRNFGEWDVVMISNSAAAASDIVEVEGLRIGLQRRRVDLVLEVDGLKVSGDKRRVASRGIEQIGLTDDQMRAAHEAHRVAQQTQDAGPTISDRFFRHERSRPLLMLHLIRASSDIPEVNGQIHAAYGISFPKLLPGEQEQRVAYTANLLAYKQIYGRADAEGDDEDEINAN